MRIGVGPAVFSAGGVLLTWQGLFTIISVCLGMYLVTRWGRARGIVPDVVFMAVIWAIIGGIIGARLVHVIDLWSEVYQADPVKVLMLWNGGLDVFGGILGGLAGVWACHAAPALRLARREAPLFGRRARFPFFATDPSKANIGRLRSLMDVSALALPLCLAVGRIAGIITGSEPGEPTGMPWGIVYTNPESVANKRYQLLATHPAVAYELLWDLLIFGALWYLKDRVRPDGMLFALFIGLYAVGRFFIGFLRFDKVWLVGMGMAQLVALVVLIVIVPVVAYQIEVVRKSGSAASRRSRG